MKKLVFLSLTLVSFIFFSCSTSYMIKSNRPQEINKDKAIVYFMLFGYGASGDMLSIEIWDGNSFTGFIRKQNSMVGYVCDPGKHLFLIGNDKMIYLPAELAAGKAYYVTINISFQINSGQMNAILADIEPLKKDKTDWQKVKKAEQGLIYMVPVIENIKNWEQAHKVRIEKYIKDYYELGSKSYEEKKQKSQKIEVQDGI